jgi:hypothetical protein
MIVAPNPSLVDTFAQKPLPRWVRLAVGPADVEWSPGRLRFVVADAVEDQLADAEIGDYRHHPRTRLPWQPPLRMAVRARFSHPAEDLAGTSGFGFWNDPFAMGGGKEMAPPNVLWFFCASSRSDMVTSPGMPGNGFRAEMINGGTMPGWLARLGNQLLQLPGLAPLLYQVAQTQVNGAGVRLGAVDMTGWHHYVLHWERAEAVFSVDESEVLRVSHPPAVPLGFVAWMDSQVAVARPDGEFRFGLESVPGRQWLELDRVEIEAL